MNRTKATGTSGRERLLAAAIDQLANSYPSDTGVRKLARQAGVHHTFVAQSFGSLQDLLSLAYRQSFEEFRLSLDNSSWPDDRMLPGSDHAFWRLYGYRVLDGSNSPLLVGKGDCDPVALLAGKIRAARPKLSPDKCDLYALAGWCIHLGSFLFANILARGLNVGRERKDEVMARVSEFVVTMCLSANFPLASRQSAIRQLDTQSKTLDDEVTGSGEDQLVQAAIEILLEGRNQNISGRELAKNAGVNYGLIHHYFGSKQAVFDVAFKRLHTNYVNDMVDADSQRLSEPFALLAHSGFVNAWARRELSGIETPNIPYTGMAKTLELLRSGMPVDEMDEIRLKSKAWCLVSLQLGFAICQHDATRDNREKSLAGLRSIFDAQVSNWRRQE